MKRKILLVPGFLLTFCAGIVIGAIGPFTTEPNEGLVEALDSVGKNLFGYGMFGAQLNPTTPSGPDQVQIDLVVYPPDPVYPTLFPKRVNFAFYPTVPSDHPPDPCKTGLQINIAPDGSLSGIIDPDIVPVFEIQTAEVGIPGAYCDNTAIVLPGD